MNRRGFVKTIFGGLFGVAIVPAVPLLRGRPRRAELPAPAIDLDHPVLHMQVDTTRPGLQVSHYVKVLKEGLRDVHFMGRTFHLPVLNRWYHLMVWYDPTGRMRGFVNGVEQP